MTHAALTLALLLAAQPLWGEPLSAEPQSAEPQSAEPQSGQPLPVPSPVGRPVAPAVQAMPLDLARVAQVIAGRYRGRLLAIRLDRPHPSEAALGVRQVYEADYLTVFDNRLTIRLDAQTGAFLLVDGAGQTRARILP